MCAQRVLADTALAIPALTEALPRARSPKDAKAGKSIAERKRAVGEIARRAAAPNGARKRSEDWDASPISPAAARLGGVGADQERGLGADHQRLRELGAETVGFRPALPLAGQAARHRHADRHGDRRRARPSRQGPPGRRLPDRRRPDVRCRRALVRRQAQDPDAVRDAQQPRLLQRLGAPDHGRAPAQHAGRARLYRHGYLRPGARFRDARALHGLVCGRADRASPATSRRR